MSTKTGSNARLKKHSIIKSPRPKTRSISFSRKASKPTPSPEPPEKNLSRASLPVPILKAKETRKEQIVSNILVTRPAPRRSKVTLEGLEKIIYQAAKKLFPRKRITQIDVQAKWKQSGILPIEDFAELPKTLRENALDGDRHFYLSLHDLRKLYNKIEEDKIRQYAYIVERYIRSCYED